ncbi:hypothetical protein BGZ70_001228, partial [Mortierella alpina]
MLTTDGECVAAVVLRHLTERPYLWLQSASSPIPSSILAQNENLFMRGVVRNVILGLVGDPEVVDHWSRDLLPNPNGFEELYAPDYYAEFEAVPLFVIEIKKLCTLYSAQIGSKKRRVSRKKATMGAAASSLKQRHSTIRASKKRD